MAGSFYIFIFIFSWRWFPVEGKFLFVYIITIIIRVEAKGYLFGNGLRWRMSRLEKLLLE